jgi:hypothetical protein
LSASRFPTDFVRKKHDNNPGKQKPADSGEYYFLQA